MAGLESVRRWLQRLVAAADPRDPRLVETIGIAIFSGLILWTAGFF